jgi:hypothetical protein
MQSPDGARNRCGRQCDPELRRHLLAEFATDVAALSDLLGRDLAALCDSQVDMSGRDQPVSAR